MSGTDRSDEDGYEEGLSNEPGSGEESSPIENLFDDPEAENEEADEQLEPRVVAKTYQEIVEENSNLKNRLLKALAETENVRKRSAREKDDASKYAISNFARDLLEVSDNLQRALASVTDEARAHAGETLLNLLEGVEITEKVLHNVLEKSRVTLVDPAGERFDPNFHQAITEIHHPEKPHGTVLDVMQRGYVIGDRLLRPAMVTIAKGGPPAPKPAPEKPAAPKAPEVKAGEQGDDDGPEPGSTINTSA